MDDMKNVADLLLYNMAKAYTDKVVDEAKPKVIDLDEYNIGAAILNLFASGGGSYEMPGLQFLVDAATEGELRLVMSGMGMSFVVDQCVRIFADGVVAQIAFAITLVYNGQITTISVAITGGASAIEIHVAVT